MTNRTRTMAAAAVAVLALTGCTEPQVPTPTPTPTESTTPTPTPSPTPALSAEQQAAATAVVRFYEVVNQIATTDVVPLNHVYDVAAGDAAETWSKDLQAMKGAGWIQRGLAVPDVRQVEGEAAPFVVTTCVDTSEADVVDGDGNSMVGEGNPTRILYDFTVDPVGGQLRVVKSEAVSSTC